MYKETFLLEDEFQAQEILACIKGYVKKDKDIKIEEIKADFDIGEFVFIIKTEKREFNILLIKEEINRLWRFLETVTISKKPLIFYSFNYKGEFILYINPVSDTYINFVIIINSSICLNLRIKRKTIVKEFYLKLKEVFDNYKSIAYFEKPFINFNYWRKDSKVIEKYLR